MNTTHLLNEGLNAAKNGPPVPPGKNAPAAFLAGFLFGPFGTGIYLESFADFIGPMLFVLGATFLTGGIAAPVAWCFCGFWGAMRVSEQGDGSK